MLRLITGLTAAYGAACKADAANCGCRDSNFADYRGTINRTSGGWLCQNWADQSPQPHTNYDVADYPELTGNSCRNPGMSEKQAWCYTVNPRVRWQYCTVPACGESTTTTTTFPAPCDADITTCKCSEGDGRGREYRGYVAKTVTGYDCLRWDALEPYYHQYWQPYAPENSAEGMDANYCRNPRGGVGARSAPWCFTTNALMENWDYCDVEFCTVKTTTTTSCMYLEPKKCGCAKDNQRGYRGTVNVTKSGIRCQPWKEQEPQIHHEYRVDMKEYATEGLEEDYCRNPFGNEDGPWCYSASESKRWELCDIPICDDDAPPSGIVVEITNQTVAYDFDYEMDKMKGAYSGSVYNTGDKTNRQLYYDDGHYYVLTLDENREKKMDPFLVDWSTDQDDAVEVVMDVLTMNEGNTVVVSACKNMINFHEDVVNQYIAAYDANGTLLWKNWLEQNGNQDQINSSLIYLDDTEWTDGWGVGQVYFNYTGDNKGDIQFVKYRADGYKSDNYSLTGEINCVYGMRAESVIGHKFAIMYKEDEWVYLSVYSRYNGEVYGSETNLLKVKSVGDINGDEAFHMNTTEYDDYQSAKGLDAVFLDTDQMTLMYSKCDISRDSDSKCSKPKVLYKDEDDKKISHPRVQRYNDNLMIAYYQEGGLIKLLLVDEDGELQYNVKNVGKTPKSNDVSTMELNLAANNTVVINGIYTPSYIQFTYTTDGYDVCDYHLKDGTMKIVDIYDPDFIDSMDNIELTVESDGDYDYDEDSRTLTFTAIKPPTKYTLTATDKQDKSYTADFQWPQCMYGPKIPTPSSTTTPVAPTDLDLSIVIKRYTLSDYKQKRNVGPLPQSKRNPVDGTNYWVFYNSQKKQLIANKTDSNGEKKKAVNITYQKTTGLEQYPSDVITLPDGTLAVCSYVRDKPDNPNMTTTYVTYLDDRLNLKFERILRVTPGTHDLNCKLNTVESEGRYHIGVTVTQYDEDSEVSGLGYYVLNGANGHNLGGHPYPVALQNETYDSMGSYTMPVKGGKLAVAFSQDKHGASFNVYDVLSGDLIKEGVLTLEDVVTDMRHFSMNVGDADKQKGESKTVDIVYRDEDEVSIMYTQCDTDDYTCTDAVKVVKSDEHITFVQLEKIDKKLIIAYAQKDGSTCVSQVDEDGSDVEDKYCITKTPAQNDVDTLTLNVMSYDDDIQTLTLGGMWRPSNKMFFYVLKPKEYCDYIWRKADVIVNDIVDANPEDSLDDMTVSVYSKGRFNWRPEQYKITVYGGQKQREYDITVVEDKTGLSYTKSFDWPQCYGM